MSDPMLDDQRLLNAHVGGRSIIPLLRPHFPRAAPPLSNLEQLSLSARPGAENFIYFDEYPDPNDVQGDVIYLFPKKAQNFIFFRIAHANQFKKALGTFLDQITTSKQIANFILEIAQWKANPLRSGLITKANAQIAFSRMGMYAMGIREPIGDARFDKFAMRDNKTFLTDQRDWDPAFEKTNFDPINGSVNDDVGALHGVITVAGSDPDICALTAREAMVHFGSSITVVSVEKGRARPPPWNGHEHFGYEDGISQPALRGMVDPKPGQVEVDAGVIVMGYRGDPVFDDPAVLPRPAWTKGGTMMVFRKLEQFVPEFDQYLKKNGPRWREFAPPGCPVLSDDQGAELWGARLIGRWKSGAPLQLAPFKDDEAMAQDPKRNNDFDYHIRDVPSINPRTLTDLYCPFTAHTRKTVPRSLDPYIQKRYLEGGMIVRGGIPYGIEVTKDENDSGVSSSDPSEKRGLLFVCYQSSLDEGFVRQTVGYAGNDYFPATSILPTNHGQDPIIGAPPPPARTTPAQNEVEYIRGTTGALPENVLLNLDDGKKLGVFVVPSIDPIPIVDPPGILVQFVPNPRVQPDPVPGENLNLVLPPRPTTYNRIPVTGITDMPIPGVDVKYVSNPRVPLQNGDQVNLVLDTANGDEIIVSGVAKVRSKSAIPPPGYPQEFFVTSRGGEWFFVPPISTLDIWSKMIDRLDIMFILDSTSNMQTYLNQVRDSVESILIELANSGPWDQQDIRIGIVAFRDHPQIVQGSTQSYGFVTKVFPFESDVAKIKANVASLTSEGGGDGPEAQCDGLADALSAGWRDDAVKVAILVTDSPPHGIGEVSDYFPDGCPDKKDPVSIVDLMAKKGITLHTLACEINLSGNYSRAHDFYNGVTRKTCGYMDALSDVTTLKTLVLGRVLESVDIRNQADDQRSFIESQLQDGSGLSEVSQSLYDKLRAAKVQLYQFVVESIYKSNQNADDNADAWFKATKIDSTTTDNLKKVGLRIKSEYRGGGKAQPMELKKSDVTLFQCEQIVRACQSTN